MNDGYDPSIALSAVAGGRVASKPFNSLFAPLPFIPPSSAKSIQSIIRDEVLAKAAEHFNRETPTRMVNAYVPSTTKTAKPANMTTLEGYETFFLPLPQLTPSGAEIMTRDGNKLMFLRVDVQKGMALRGVEVDDLIPFFRHCKGLGVVDRAERKWVWLSRCIAPRQHVMYPYTAGTDRAWTQVLSVGGNLTAQAKAEFEGQYRVPKEDATAQANKEYWAMLFSGIKEEGVDEDRLAHIETPAPRAELIDAEAIDKAVVAFTKMRTAVAGSFTAESQDKPVHDKPSTVAEIAGAVAVAAGVALATGVVAAIV